MARRPGTQHVPHTQQQHGAHGSMEYNHSNQNVSSPSDLNARRPTQPGNQGTITQTTQTEDCHLIFQSRATLYDKTKRVRNIVHRFWLWEILAYCFSLICMGTVVVVLINEDGKPLDQWGFRITPNTVISFIVTLAKSAFLLAITETISQLKWLHFHSESHRLSDLQLFDEASRGPFGSLKLLFTRHKNSLLASCAASVMLATLFIDPFIQLVFTFPSQRTLIPLVNHASIQIAQLYDPNQYQFDSHETSAVASSVGTGMQGAILAGLYNGSNQLSLSCPTGNCTWTGLTTLGLCSECDDISHEIKTDCPGRTERNNGQYQCDYAMPLNLTLNGWIYSYGGSGIYSQTRWNSSTAPLDILNSDPDTQAPAILSMFEAVQLPEGSSIDILPPPTGFRCTILFCTKKYHEINVTNGIPTVSKPEEEALMLSHVSKAPCGPQCGPEVFMNMIPNSSITANTTRNPENNFTINIADYANIQAYLSELFSTGWYELGNSIPSTSTTRNEGTVARTAPDIGRELANTANLSQTIRAITDSMTESIRTNPNSTAQPGLAYVERPVIRIRWGWLAYPLTLMFMTLVILAIVIMQTQQRRMVPWKSSGLALLFYGLEGWGEEARSRVENQRDLEEVAGRMEGTLVGSEWEAVGEAGERLAFVKTNS